ncbi:hypothetical protein VP01_6969g1 [Puccinia sorghi]|uniref:Uncharacterized protein n=1 Tax=Puccinia sorghi TaxID=27349 RepID=A0A0L6UG56_9BASI|nr:hypothetical protein VP01_6969g1 [Puccinia sorghi]
MTTGKQFTFENAWIKFLETPEYRIILDKTPHSSFDLHPLLTKKPNPEIATNNGQHPGGVKAATRALTYAKLMKNKLKPTEASTTDTVQIKQLKMFCTNYIQERLVNMKISSKELSSCLIDFDPP